MAIGNYSLFWTANPNFGPKNANVIKNMPTVFLKFYKVSYGELVVCQKFAVKRYPIKS